jgi:organic hydroperoxide reductase OsmC/OhrA
MSEDTNISFALTLTDGYAFTVDFTGTDIPPMTIDESPPLGGNAGPNPSRVLASAIASCMASSLLFCLRKARVEVGATRVDVTVTSGRNSRGRLRVKAVDLVLAPTVPADQVAMMTRCLEVYEDYCVVSGSIREGITITSRVEPAAAS